MIGKMGKEVIENDWGKEDGGNEGRVLPAQF